LPWEGSIAEEKIFTKIKMPCLPQGVFIEVILRRPVAKFTHPVLLILLPELFNY
jgi:hypothetical protein